MHYLTFCGTATKDVSVYEVPHRAISIHVETVVALGREFSKDVEYAYLDYEPSKNIPFKGDAIYSEIKNWILDKYGLKVSSLYVAQIKDKCGIKGYEAYNHGKGEHHVPNCPPEKEEAIRAAFEHFNMI